MQLFCPYRRSPGEDLRVDLNAFRVHVVESLGPAAVWVGRDECVEPAAGAGSAVRLQLGTKLNTERDSRTAGPNDQPSADLQNRTGAGRTRTKKSLMTRSRCMRLREPGRDKKYVHNPNR